MTPKRRSSRVKLFLAVAGAAALVAFFVYRWRTGGFAWHEFAATFVDVRWGWLVLSIPVILLTYAGRALRWTVMVRPLKEGPSFWNILEATCIGFTAIVFFGRAGELVRPYLIAAREKLPFPSQLGAWLLERILDLLMVIVIFGMALAQISRSGVPVGPKMTWIMEAGGTIILLAGVGCILFILLFRYMSESMHRRIMEVLRFLPEASQKRAEKLLGAFIEGMGSTRSGGFVARLLLYSVLEWAIIAGCFVCMFRAFPATEHFSLTDVVVFLGVVSLGSAIQIPGVGGGMQVASILVLTEFFRLSLEVATGISLVIWAVSFLVVVPVGLFLAFREGLNLRKLTRMTEEKDPPEQAALP
jgi:glycosyltransferase 2 family protein